MKRSLLSLAFLLMALPSFSFQDPFQWEYKMAPQELTPGGTVAVSINFLIPEGYYLYRDKTGLTLLEGEGASLSHVTYSPSHKKTDPFFGKEMDVFEDVATIHADLQRSEKIPSENGKILLLLTYQGCSQSLCYRQMRHEISVPIKGTLGKSLEESPPVDSSAIGTGKRMIQKSFFWTLLAAFIGGILTDLTPCVLPIIPLTLAFIGVRRGQRRSRNFLLSTVLILVMAISYALLGLIGTVLGKSLGFLFQGIPFLVALSLLYLFFAIVLMGWIPFHLPVSLQTRISRWGGEGFLGAVLAGMTVGILAAPCVGPVLGSLLLYVSQSGSLVAGFTLLFAFGLGMGSLFLVAAIFYHSLAGRSWGGSLTLWSKRLLALLMILLAGYYALTAHRQIGKNGLRESSSSFWMTDPETAFLEAAKQDRPIFVDFFAEWCLPCLEMERRTFNQETFQEFLKTDFVPLKIDCTVETPTCKRMVERYQVFGWPTYLILDREGRVLQRFVGEVMGPKELTKRLQR
ncbi:MAG: thioredoxin family protein [Deltaproteobacteria bacterium]|nr:thioredoxin family protein [Deltaproteobacteria bacterium]